MNKIEAVMFDLDETLLDREKAVGIMFDVIIDKFYKNTDITKKQYNNMLCEFKKYDNRGYGDKTVVMDSLFNEFTPSFMISKTEFLDFWDRTFHKCFSRDEERINTVIKLQEYVKTAIITNGSVKSQSGKIEYTNLDKLFEVIIVSDEVGIKKPDPKIFELALSKIDVLPENALFVGDDLKNDIYGCQNAGMLGIWYNPYNFKNDTDIKPFAEIHSFTELLSYINL
ncbi:MAG: HAD family hydrolase [Oscillospiraceae bacterium]|nr:HAD family hydrolase [Oscillospiraceae bacterium]